MEPKTPIVLSVCMRCRRPDWSGDDAARPGAQLASACRQMLERANLDQPVLFRSIRCMSQCKRPCVVAFSGENRFTYLFGDLDPDRDAGAVTAALRLYGARPDGFMERDRRPPALQAGIPGRIPPLNATQQPVETRQLFRADAKERLPS